MSVCEYVDAKHNIPGATQAHHDRLVSLGAFHDGIERFCEIGPGSGRYLEKTLQVCHPTYREIYETAGTGVLTRQRDIMRLSNAASAFFCSDAKPGYRLAAGVLAVVFVLASLVMIKLGPAPITGPWDVVILLNAGWRLVCGQIPHVDFHNPIGMLTYIPMFYGMKVVGPSVAAIVYGIILLAAVLLPWAWALAAKRFLPFLAFTVVLFFGFLLISPRPLGYGIRETTYAMIYNREGYVLLAMLLISVFLPARTAAKGAPWLGGLSVGLLLGLLLYCKITFFVAGAASALLSLVLHRRSIWWWLAAGAGCFCICAGFHALFHVSLAAYLSDIKTAAQSQSGTMRLQLLKEALRNNYIWIYLSFLFLGLWTAASQLLEKRLPSSAGAWLVGVWIIAVALFIESGNSAQRGGVDDPLYFVAGIIVIESYRRTTADEISVARSAARFLYVGELLVVLPIFCGSILLADAASFSYSAAWNLTRRPAFEDSRRIQAGPLGDLLVPKGTSHITCYWPAREFPARMNEGIALLRKHLSANDRVTTLGCTDPFSVAFRLHPALDGNLWWDYHVSFDGVTHPSPSQFLGDASLVMVPRPISGLTGLGFDSVDAMLNVYGNYLQKNFQQIDSSEAWLLYRRR